MDIISYMLGKKKGEAGGHGADEVEKNVFLYDYDGTVAYSYTKEEFLQLTELPSNPTHIGLTAQGWNWSFIDAKNYVQKYGRLNISQCYITDDAKTRIYIHLDENNLEPYLGFGINGTATVDWGDGSSLQNITGNNDTSVYYITNTKHTYENAGDYVITITNEVKIAFYGFTNYSSRIVWNNTSSSNDKYANSIKKIELGKNVYLGNYAFLNCKNLKLITMPSNITQSTILIETFKGCALLNFVSIPDTITGFGDSVFSGCYHIEHIALPSGLLNCGTGIFNSCYSLEELLVPDNMTAIPSNTFYYCYNLTDVVIPEKVKSIGSNSFNNCSRLKNVIIPNNIETIQQTAFSGATGIKNIKLSNSLTSLNNETFKNCVSLRGIFIPKNILNIGSSVFYSCSSLEYVDFSEHTEVPQLSNANSFQGVFVNYKIIVPNSLYNDWVNTSVWSDLSSHIVKS